MGASGLALATSISSYIGVAIMVVQLRKRFGRFGTRRTLRELGRILARGGRLRRSPARA